MDRNPPGSSVHGKSLGKNTGVGCHALLQGIFPTQESCIGRGFFSTSATQAAWGQSLPPLLPSCVLLGNSENLSVPYFLISKVGIIALSFS